MVKIKTYVSLMLAIGCAYYGVFYAGTNLKNPGQYIDILGLIYAALAIIFILNAARGRRILND